MTVTETDPPLQDRAAARRQGMIAVNLAALLFGGTALFSKLIEANAWHITLHRAWIAILALVALRLIRRQDFALDRPRDYGIQLLIGACLGLHWATYFHSMQVSTVAVGLISLYTAPILTVLIDAAWRRHRPPGRDLILAGGVFAGVVLLVPSYDLGNSTFQGVLWGLLSALLLSIRGLVHGPFTRGHGGPKLMMYQAVGILLAFSIVPVFDPGLPAAHDWGWLVILGIVFTAIPHALIAIGLGALPAKTVVLITSLMLVYGTFLAWLLLGEEPAWRTIAGGAVIATCATIESLAARK